MHCGWMKSNTPLFLIIYRELVSITVGLKVNQHEDVNTGTC